jgi:crotonobetainyl-CoA:carnitine CoA-transferase CaiB-like acyl-CoA transferase
VTPPLHDIRVCDVSQNLAGPFCSQILADLGATVIKVEPPGGDLARAWGPPFWGEESALFLSANRGKRSIILDLKHDAGREALHRLARSCDVFLQASRQGVPKRLGFDYATVRALRGDVVYMSVSAYGARGPLSDLPGYDPLMQAFSGVMSVTGHPGSPPTRVGGSVVDYGTGMWAAIAILAALRTRDATGEGAELETSLMDTALGWVSYHLTGYLATGHVPGPMGSALSSIAPYQAFATRDGHVMIAAGNDAIFRRLCAALGVEQLADDPRFRTNPARAEHREELSRLLEERTRRLSTEELVEVTRRHAVPGSAIHDVAEVVEHPQVAAAQMLTSAPHPRIPDYRDVALPLRMSGARPHGEAPPPRVGEHTREVLREVGYTEVEVDGLVEGGVAREG